MFAKLMTVVQDTIRAALNTTDSKVKIDKDAKTEAPAKDTQTEAHAKDAKPEAHAKDAKTEALAKDTKKAHAKDNKTAETPENQIVINTSASTGPVVVNSKHANGTMSNIVDEENNATTTKVIIGCGSFLLGLLVAGCLVVSFIVVI